ncbi:MAG: BatD family protein [Candidatus Omnitrophica bacterium]|nr:BatD family protein [Candidatus Omnitrophota bacterium]
MRKVIVGCLSFLSVFVFPLAPVFSNDLGVHAQVDKTEVATGDVLAFSVTIAGAFKQPPRVELKSFEGFDVVGTRQAQQIQIHGGKALQALTLIYTLAPKEVGTHVLGPVKVEYEGQVYETQPIEVKVVKGSEPRREEKSKRSEKRRMPRLQGGVVL